jgi:DNA modification methylase
VSTNSIRVDVRDSASAKERLRNRIIVGDARSATNDLLSDSIDCIVTSPPYFRLRNYQHRSQIGLEQNVSEWVDEMTTVLRGLKRVLKPSGSLWLNLGDTFSTHERQGARPKSLLLAPERLAMALTADGWVLRNKVIWSKPNPMPTSVRDRLSCTWEIVYFFVRSNEYYFDLDAIRVPHRSRHTKTHHQRTAWSVPNSWRGPSSGSNTGLDRLKALGLPGHPLGKNPGDVWTIPTAGYRGAHHAVFPERLARVPLLATCPEKVCAGCGVPWTRDQSRRTNRRKSSTGSEHHELKRRCECETQVSTRPGIVLDPFIGSGTTAIVAEAVHRDWLGIELNPEFAALATDRIAAARYSPTERPTDLSTTNNTTTNDTKGGANERTTT